MKSDFNTCLDSIMEEFVEDPPGYSSFLSEKKQNCCYGHECSFLNGTTRPMTLTYNIVFSGFFLHFKDLNIHETTHSVGKKNHFKGLPPATKAELNMESSERCFKLGQTMTYFPLTVFFHK